MSAHSGTGVRPDPPEKPERRDILRAIRHFVRDYTFVVFSRSSMHGAWHVTQKCRHRTEFYFWLLMVVAAAAGSAATVWQFRARSSRSPVVVSVDRGYLRWNTTFPAITICGREKLNETSFERFIHSFIRSDRLGPPANRTRSFVRTLVNLRLDHAFDVPVHENTITADTYVRILFKLTAQPQYRAQIGRGPNRLDLPFRATLTDLGICETFNWPIAVYLSPEYYVMEQKGDGQEAEGSGSSDLLEVNSLDSDWQRLVTVANVQESEIYVHGPYDTPNSKTAIRIGHRQLATGAAAADGRPHLAGGSDGIRTFRFKALTFQAGQHVRDLPVAERKCRFHDESNLAHFPHTYSPSLCQLECRIQSILTWCQCVPMYFKALAGERTCNVLGLNCLHWFKDQIEQHVDRCPCLKSCEDVRYFLDSTARHPSSASGLNGQLASARLAAEAAPAQLRIELVPPRRRLQLEILHSDTDNWVSIGATLGLFLGVSALSLAEIAYWHLLHLPILLRNAWRKRRQAGIVPESR